MTDLHRKLIDLYAGEELSEELEQELVAAANQEPEMSQEMQELRRVYLALRQLPKPEFTAESHERILMKMLARGADLNPRTPTPRHLQYDLPIFG